MKLFHVISFLTKATISIAGVAFLVKKVNEIKDDDHYRFTLESAISNEAPKVNHRFSTRNKFNIADLQNAYIRAQDR
jgi:hypothetical protein